jgi:hypothetical protein
MSWGVGLRVGVAIGIGSLATFFSGNARDQEFNNLATESNDNLVQEDGSFILV